MPQPDAGVVLVAEHARVEALLAGEDLAEFDRRDLLRVRFHVRHAHAFEAHPHHRLDELRELTGERLADADEHDFHTVAGLVIAHFGRIPHVGEHFQLGQWRVEVVDLDGPRIDKLLLQRMQAPAAVEADA